MAYDEKGLLHRGSVAKRESKYVEFKERFDPSSLGEWCEILKDIVAMANTGGGVLVIGVRNNGSPSDEDLTDVLTLDPARITDQVYKYTGKNFSGCELHEVKRGDHNVAAILIAPTRTALLFNKAGTYSVNVGGKKPKEKQAFSEGVIYVRHGAKSEPATADDVEEIITRRLDQIREAWLGGIKKVVTAPEGVEVMTVSALEHDHEGAATKVRLTTDPGAPVFGRVNPDETHPYRQTELIAEVNERITAMVPVNSHDLLAVRRAHQIRPGSHPDFCHQPRYGSPQYSDAFVDWLVEQYERDDEFFIKARKQFRKLQQSAQASGGS